MLGAVLVILGYLHPLNALLLILLGFLARKCWSRLVIEYAITSIKNDIFQRIIEDNH